MQVIKENVSYQEEIKHSKFITLLYKVNNIDDVNYYLKKVREDYKGATHYCYAFNLLNTSGYSDDKEPKNTAGRPMLFILTSNNIINILVISVRYFGGIKLGTGGLLKAYTNGLLESLKKSILLNVVNGYLITCELIFCFLRSIICLIFYLFIDSVKAMLYISLVPIFLISFVKLADIKK